MQERRIAMLMTSTILSVPSTALAQEAPTQVSEAQTSEDATVLGDIVVTAQRRAERLQESPLPITAIGGTDLRSRQLVQLEDLAPSLPNVNFGRNVGIGRIAVRGIGFDSTVPAQEGRVAYHLDGVYISPPRATLTSLFDVDRVEVVRGPQGTLYGRNATGGAVNVLTGSPTETLSGYAKVTVGNYALINTEGAISGPVSDTITARFAFQTLDRDGYGRNFTTDQEIDNEHSFGVRGKIKFEPTGSLTVTISADYSLQDDQNYVYHFIGQGSPTVVPFGLQLGGRVPDNPRDSFGDAVQINDRRYYGFAAIVDLDLGFGTLTSITAHRGGKSFYQTEGDGTSALGGVFRTTEISNQLSQELRLAGKWGSLDYVVGGYYFNEDTFGRLGFSPLRQVNRLTSQGTDFQGNFTTHAYALFGQLDYEILSGLTASAGARYSYEKKRVNQRIAANLAVPFVSTNGPFTYTGLQDAEVTFDDVTPRFGLQYQATPDIMLYALYSVGFKSGGFGLGANAPPLRPEKLKNYEGGVKAEWFDRRLRTNLSAFYYDYSNLQVQQIVGIAAVPTNAAAAEVKGFEAEIAARPIDALDLSLNVSLLDAQFISFTTADAARTSLGPLNLAGNRLSQAPEYTVNAAAAYTLTSSIGDFTLRGEGTWTDRVFFSSFNRPEVSQPAHAKFNAFLLYNNAESGFNASLFVRNIANKRTLASSLVSAFFTGFPNLGAFDPPRTFGASIGYRF